MLVLTRRPGQAIKVGNSTIVVVSTSNSKVKLGIEAPLDITVLRDELLQTQVENEIGKTTGTGAL